MGITLKGGSMIVVGVRWWDVSSTGEEVNFTEDRPIVIGGGAKVDRKS